ncbi:MAG: peptidylprolyl isomerase [Verrucomicrobia bacterium]|nr:peptidylprolyl isomerase [Verrucomicrobiota bacterium]
MTRHDRFVLRLGIYGAVFVYLICDLHFCGGPLSRHLRPADPQRPAATAKAKAGGVVARVYGYQIHRSQLERAVRERLWRDGRTLAELTPQNRQLIRYAALEDLIDHELLRTKVSVNTSDLTVSADEVNERLRRFTARFPTKPELEAAMAAQGLGGEQDLRERLAARIQQEKYVELRVAPLVKVSDEEARKWFEDNQQRLVTPERIEARHLFLPTLERDADAARQVLVGALAALTDKSKDFATLARELSEDPATKNRGGALGWMTRERLPDDLAVPLFTLPLNQPSLLRSKLGWHLIEVTARRPAEPRTFEQAKPEILSALEAVKRRQATTDFRNELRKFEARNIDIYRDMVEE